MQTIRHFRAPRCHALGMKLIENGGAFTHADTVAAQVRAATHTDP